MQDKYSFCEGLGASSSSRWHIRRQLDKKKLGGGIDTGSLCNRIKLRMGWDLEAEVYDHKESRKDWVCPNCWERYCTKMSEANGEAQV